MTFLLDVNVLIALVDPLHIGHSAAHRWFDTTGSFSWATCPLTENGVMRIVGHPRYPNSPGSPAAVAPQIERLRSLSGHEFWQDEISLMNSEFVDITRVTTPHQVTDTYLLALAVAKNGKLATFDPSIGNDSGAAGAHCAPPDRRDVVTRIPQADTASTGARQNVTPA